MREILFRGKRVDNGKWVYGYYNRFVHYLDESEIHTIIEAPATLYPRADVGEVVEVIPETVGQYTGLTDMNGNMIFEGDILDGCSELYTEMYGHPKVFIGEFVDGESEYNGYGVCISTLRVDACIAQEHADEYEIIGNIHDNPELKER